MHRYHYLPTLGVKVTEMARVAFLSLEECNLLPQNSRDVTEHIYDILKGEAWEYIIAYRKDIVLILREWEREKEIQWAKDRILREEQEKLYADACIRDSSVLPCEDSMLRSNVESRVEETMKENWYHFRNHEKRVRVALTLRSKMKEILDAFSTSVPSFVLILPDGDSILVDAGKTLQEYNLRCDCLYHLETM